MKTLKPLSPVLALLFAAGCATPRTDSLNPSYEKNTVVHDQKTAYIQATINHLDEIEKKIRGWKIEAREASGSAKDTRYDAIVALEKKLDTARSELNKLKAASVSEYKNFKDNVDEAVADVDAEFQNSGKSFR